MVFVTLLFGLCILNAITQFITSQIESIKLQTVIAQYSPPNNGELWMSYQNMRWCFLQWVIEASRGGNEEEKWKFYMTSCSFCLCNSRLLAKSGSRRSHSLRKWRLTILGAGAYLTHPESGFALTRVHVQGCSLHLPSPCKAANPLNHACPCIETL